MTVKVVSGFVAHPHTPLVLAIAKHLLHKFFHRHKYFPVCRGPSFRPSVTSHSMRYFFATCHLKSCQSFPPTCQRQQGRSRFFIAETRSCKFAAPTFQFQFLQCLHTYANFSNVFPCPVLHYSTICSPQAPHRTSNVRHNRVTSHRSFHTSRCAQSTFMRLVMTLPNSSCFQGLPSGF